ncbi:unnamed protein product [Brassicogethes aeneus]|uniref:Uncharacterized protein n=1 Tax=Brassicogethes aeneus TaxID=1431903 RepID=A0A9P0FHL9_BRAAE|nr:unnamed protein product [Brassicogethes aeneus]
MPKPNMKTAKLDFNKICRTCLSNRGHLREIFSTKIPRMIENLTSLEVSKGDNLPTSICVNCFHLIAKLYTFKKKIERSDRILRKNKFIQSDILNIALNDAQIDENTNNKLEYEECDSEEDIPLSKRLQLEKLKKEQTTTEIITMENVEIVETNLFSDGPPPLVPLEPKKIVGGVKIPDLPKDTPPLIPIKPLVNLETVIKQKDIKLQCNNCGQDFQSLADLKDHKLKVCQQNSLQCNICKKEFKERKKLIGHLKGHMVVKDYRCNICGKCYPNNSSFSVHMRTHTGEKPFKCEVCNKAFVRWGGVVGHMKTHETEKPYKCDKCDKTFKIPSNLERHKVLHADILPYCCSYCGKTFSQSDNLMLHVRSYHTKERPFLCNECGKGFVSSTRLKRHMWVHTGYKPYQCDLCMKAYTNSSDLKNHRNQHYGQNSKRDKPYACLSCNMRFYHPCRLQRHVKIHEKPYLCEICLKSFSTETFLHKHVQTKHNREMVEEVLLEDEDVNNIFVQYE